MKQHSLSIILVSLLTVSCTNIGLREKDDKYLEAQASAIQAARNIEFHNLALDKVSLYEAVEVLNRKLYLQGHKMSIAVDLRATIDFSKNLAHELEILNRKYINLSYERVSLEKLCGDIGRECGLVSIFWGNQVTLVPASYISARNLYESSFPRIEDYAKDANRVLFSELYIALKIRIQASSGLELILAPDLAQDKDFISSLVLMSSSNEMSVFDALDVVTRQLSLQFYLDGQHLDRITLAKP